MSTKEKLVSICPICGKEIGIITFEGKEVWEGCEVSNYDTPVCPTCTEENYFECEKCESLHPNDEALYINSESISICKGCATDYVKCDNCGDYESADNMNNVGDGDKICDYCYENNYSSCNGCGEMFNNNNMNYNDDDDRFCPDCYEEYRDVIDGYHSSRTIRFFGANKNDAGALFLGAEIEIDHGNNRNSTAKEMKKCFEDKFMFMENDGSLDDGFENITQPATLEYHTSIKEQYESAFDIAIDNGFKSHKTSTCGLHVHFNRSFFADNEELYTARLLYIVSKFWDNMTKFSRRSLNSLERWAKKINDKPEDFVKASKEGHGDRYYAVNLTNTNTIEFRMFKGTLKLNTYIATLQLVNTIVRSAKTLTVEQIQAMQWEDLLQYDEIKTYWESVKNRSVN